MMNSDFNAPWLRATFPCSEACAKHIPEVCYEPHRHTSQTSCSDSCWEHKGKPWDFKIGQLRQLLALLPASHILLLWSFKNCLIWKTSAKFDGCKLCQQVWNKFGRNLPPWTIEKEWKRDHATSINKPLTQGVARNCCPSIILKQLLLWPHTKSQTSCTLAEVIIPWSEVQKRETSKRKDKSHLRFHHWKAKWKWPAKYQGLFNPLFWWSKGVWWLKVLYIVHDFVVMLPLRQCHNVPETCRLFIHFVRCSCMYPFRSHVPIDCHVCIKLRAEPKDVRRHACLPVICNMDWNDIPVLKAFAFLHCLEMPALWCSVHRIAFLLLLAASQLVPWTFMNLNAWRTSTSKLKRLVDLVSVWTDGTNSSSFTGSFDEPFLLLHKTRNTFFPLHSCSTLKIMDDHLSCHWKLKNQKLALPVQHIYKKPASKSKARIWRAASPGPQRQCGASGCSPTQMVSGTAVSSFVSCPKLLQIYLQAFRRMR